MTEPLQPLTDDDLAAARKLLDAERYECNRLWHTLQSALAEVERLRAENWRLAAQHDSIAYACELVTASLDRTTAQLRARTLSDEDVAVLRRHVEWLRTFDQSGFKALAVLDKLLKETP